MTILCWAALAGATELAPDAWLLLGPVSRPVPAFVEEPTATQLLDDGPGLGPDVGWPVVGDRVVLPEATATWASAPARGKALALPTVDAPHVAWAATVVHTDRFVEATLSLDSAQPVRVWVDGEQAAATDGLEKGDDPAEGTVSLAPGAHRVLVQTAALDGRWRVGLTLDAPDESVVRFDAAPGRPLDLAALLDVPTVTGLQLHPNGKTVAIGLATPAVPSEDRVGWTELRRVADGTLLRRFEEDLGDFTWSHDGSRWAYRTWEGDGSTLWIGAPDSPPRRLIRDMERLGGFWWLPDGRSLVFARKEELEDDEDGIRRLTSTVDRWPWGRDRSHLYQVSLDGVTRQLTAGDDSWGLLDVHPSSDRLLVSRSEHDTGERPFSREHVLELDLRTLEATEVLSSGWFGGATYRPDGEAAFVMGGPSLADGAMVPEGVTPNEYDNQLYLWTRETGELTSFTADFDPAVQWAWWRDDRLLVKAQDGPFVRLFDMDPATGAATLRSTPPDSVGTVAVARDADTVVYTGSGVSQRPAIWRGDGTLLLDPGADRFAGVRLGEVTDFEVEHDGTTLTGRVYLPPDHDPGGSYPVIVNYYGGTAPIGRSFGGRYPANWWAAHGYIVYILQPSGAIGFGQPFSARHVNDWSQTTADEVLAATDAFLEAHPSADPGRIGCIGASFGGFMTMRLVTRSDRFAAAVSHAGISNIAAYWGEGWWGYLYSALASADSYPWNNRELYVEQSPLFHADAITTPLLLLHGTTDMNVPLGESDSMFTALKVLGKDVEYVQYDGEGHHILDYPKRRQWHETIVAYFDWKLKGDDGWWAALYPEG